MQLLRLVLQDFRNVAAADLPLGDPRILLLGRNGQGKTNVLEAAGLLTALRSFRTAETRLLVREGRREGAVAWEIAHERLGTLRVSLHLRGGSRTLAWGREKVARLSDHLGVFPTVVFSSQDLMLVRGGPAERRRWLDLVLSAMEPDYFRALQDYTRALAGRNALLKADGDPDTASLSAFERILARSGAALVAGRTTGVAALSAAFARAYARLAGEGGEAASLAYDPAFDPSAPAGSSSSSSSSASPGAASVPAASTVSLASPAPWAAPAPDTPVPGTPVPTTLVPATPAPDTPAPATSAVDALLARFAATRARDLRAGTTLTGPHRDDLEITVGGRGARDFGSEGQQRSVVLALRLAQADWFHARSGIRPVLLADDVLGELDPGRRERLWAALDPACQVIATGTEVPPTAGPGAPAWRVIGVEAGVLTP